MSKTFVQDRNEALFSLDELKIRAFAKKYNVEGMSDNPIVFWASVYKSILAITNSPADLRKKAEDWLDSHVFHREIGPYMEEPEPSERIARHTFEHVTFPETFYAWGEKMVNQVVDGSRYYLSDLYSRVECEGNALQPYKPKHFNVLARSYPSGEGALTVVRIDLPKPTQMLECRRIYLCRDGSTGECMYFTSELSMQGTYFLCAWTKNHAHLLISMDPVPGEYDRVAELFHELVGFEPAQAAAV